MNKSESIAKLAPALVKAQAAIRAAIKDATNPHFRSKYADLGAVVEAVKPALVANDLTFVQGVMDAENGVAVETMLLHTSGEWISSTLRIPASKQDAQGYGSAITYGRRYGLQSMCGVPAEDDDGNAAAKGVASERIENKIANAGVTPNADAGKGLNAAQKEKIDRLCADVTDFFSAEDAQGAYDAIEAAELDNEEKLFLWSKLGSKERSTLKKLSKAARDAELKRDEAPQA